MSQANNPDVSPVATLRSNDSNSIEQVNFQNFKKYLGKEVVVEITSYHGGMIYPDRNVLIGMNEGEYFFKSIEDDGSNQYWSFSVSDEKWSCVVFSNEQNAQASVATEEDSNSKVDNQ